MKREDQYTQVQQLHEKGNSIRGIAQITGISKSAVGRMVKAMQDAGLGTPTLKCPQPAVEGVGTPTWDSQGNVPTAGLEALGTLGNSKNEAELQLIRQQVHASEELMMWSYRQNIHDSYQDFLYNTRTFLTGYLPSEELARSLIKSRQGKVRDYIKRAKGICVSCQVSYEGLYMAYVLEQLHLFLGQQPELEETERGIKLKDGTVLEQFVKKVARLDIFTPIKNGTLWFPITDIV